jgi:hypothetical protein
MKFGHLWKEQTLLFPDQLKKNCIDYKKWKKNIVTDSLFLESMLENECRQIDNIFLKNISSNFSCFKYKITKKELYNYISLNKICIYKIIKRLDKRLGTTLRIWYNAQKGKYKFFGGYQVTRLKIDVYGYNEDCPICFDKPKTIVILDCGHCVCEDCIKKIYSVNEFNGRLSNLISYAYYYLHIIPKCPICRYFWPLKDVHKKQIFKII